MNATDLNSTVRTRLNSTVGGSSSPVILSINITANDLILIGSVLGGCFILICSCCIVYLRRKKKVDNDFV